MTTSFPTLSLAEKYILPLISLSDNIKLEIISKLSASMVRTDIAQAEEGKSEVDLYHCFNGDWGNGLTTEAYCRELRKEAILEAEEIENW
ncbi:MAG: hypothetical protein KBT33_04035 [Prevotellaceae bacterium]|nr:hypothetical protein [Candidatus Minthosoma equi]